MNRSWYFVCQQCSAKAFAKTRQIRCPRCGSSLASYERITPPWKTSAPRPIALGDESTRLQGDAPSGMDRQMSSETP